MNFDNTVTVTDEGYKVFEPIPADFHNAVCFGVWDIGYHAYKGVYSHKIIIGYEVEKVIEEGQFSGKRMTHYEFYTKSLSRNEKTGNETNLRKHLVGWRGVQFTEKELKGFELNKIIGKPCTLKIGHVTKPDGNMKAKIESIGVYHIRFGEKLTPENSATELPNVVINQREKAVSKERADELMHSEKEADAQFNDFQKPREPEINIIKQAPIDQAPHEPLLPDTQPAVPGIDKDGLANTNILDRKPEPVGEEIPF